MPQYLIVDGHSIIFAWPKLRRLHARRASLAREALINELRHYQDWTSIRTTVVFDGSGPRISSTAEPYDVQILADVTVGTGVEGRVHLLFIISDPGKDDDRKSRVHLPDESDQRNAVHLRHLKIDDGDFAVMLGEPGCSLEPIGQGLASMTALTEIRDQEFCNTRIVINDEELGIF